MNLLRYIPGTEMAGVVTFTILSDKTPISGAVRVDSIYISKEVNKIPYAKIIIYDGDPSKEEFSISNSNTFIPGSEIIIRAGYNSIEKIIFKGIVIKHSIRNKMNKPSILELDCRDISVKLSVGRKNKYFTTDTLGITDSDAIEEILKAEYKNDIASGNIKMDIETTKVEHSKLIQYNATDWDFIVSRAEVNGMLVIPDDGVFKVTRPILTSVPVLSVFYGNSVFEFEAEIDARTQFSDIKGVSWDPAAGEIIEENGNYVIPATVKQGNLSTDQLSDVIELKSFIMQHSGNITKSELKAWADAKMLKSKLSKIRGKIKVSGTNAVAPGDLIQMAGFSARFNGTAYVSGVWQEIYNGVWYTTIQIGLDFKWFASENELDEKPASAMLPAITGLQIGTVTEISDDPDSECRVLVKLPVVDNKTESGIWARVAREYAGAERGFFFLPEEGDEVIIGFINDDPRDPVILGAVNSSKNTTPMQATRENNEKAIVSRSGMQILFNEKDKSVSIITPNKKTILVDDSNGVISLKDENNNIIEMNSEGITIQSQKKITLKAGTDVVVEGINISQSASSENKVEGKVKATLSSQAQTVVEGSIVNIN